jgi:hypothetical protein
MKPLFENIKYNSYFYEYWKDKFKNKFVNKDIDWTVFINLTSFINILFRETRIPVNDYIQSNRTKN